MKTDLSVGLIGEEEGGESYGTGGSSFLTVGDACAGCGLEKNNCVGTERKDNVLLWSGNIYLLKSCK